MPHSRSTTRIGQSGRQHASPSARIPAANLGGVGIRGTWMATPIAVRSRPSGDYERCIEIDAKRYGHILHPGDGLAGRRVVLGQRDCRG